MLVLALTFVPAAAGLVAAGSDTTGPGRVLAETPSGLILGKRN
ncbi:hypothetical protein AB1484_31350 [Parafrankia sp. FMc6]